ncbi:hypothetical protein CSOJ01_14850 [Colletotrichum sojae]|uniref:Uncharacterized protein n=1 Tax=Colletotrichum sojae TaxID=2175907 RepID=A0A8H6IPN2_9PEZI|nr:hypothetical protein CSOJ01_14850 [Colletotrichum sojae]
MALIAGYSGSTLSRNLRTVEANLRHRRVAIPQSASVTRAMGRNRPSLNGDPVDEWSNPTTTRTPTAYRSSGVLTLGNAAQLTSDPPHHRNSTLAMCSSNCCPCQASRRVAQNGHTFCHTSSTPPPLLGTVTIRTVPNGGG